MCFVSQRSLILKFSYSLLKKVYKQKKEAQRSDGGNLKPDRIIPQIYIFLIVVKS